MAFHNYCDNCKTCLYDRGTHPMTPDELKAELAQLAEENGRLDEVVKLLDTAYCFMLHAPAEVEAYGLGGVYTTKNPVGTDESDWCDRANALIDPPPPTPGLGAAMLRVVEAAKRVDKIAEKWLNKLNWTTEDAAESKAAHAQLHQAVQALNELEAKA